MEAVFEKTYKLETIHLDRYGRLKPSVMLYFAQEAATGHCDILQLDYETLAKKRLFWAIVRTRLQVERTPVEGEVLTVKTWPMPTTRSAFPRATEACDAEGKTVFRCLSLWVLMNMDTRKMVLPQQSDIALEGVVQGTELVPPCSVLPRDWENMTCRIVGYTELDRNGHVNNTRYIDWVSDLLDSDFHKDHTLKELTICYQAETRQGDQIGLRWQIADGPVLNVDAYRGRTDDRQTEQRVFTARVEF